MEEEARKSFYGLLILIISISIISVGMSSLLSKILNVSVSIFETISLSLFIMICFYVATINLKHENVFIINSTEAEEEDNSYGRGMENNIRGYL